MRVGVPGNGTGASEDAPHGRPKLGRHATDEKIPHWWRLSAVSPRRQSRIADVQRRRQYQPVTSNTSRACAVLADGQGASFSDVGAVLALPTMRRVVFAMCCIFATTGVVLEPGSVAGFFLSGRMRHKATETRHTERSAIKRCMARNASCMRCLRYLCGAFFAESHAGYKPI